MRRGTTGVVVVVLALVVAPAAWGQAITGWSGGSPFDSYYGSIPGDVIGWQFTVSDPLEVSDLGCWNGDSTGGIGSNHQVGIWDGSQVLIASATVTSSSTVSGAFRYEAITPVTLMPGQTYTIGALYAAGDGDSYISGASGITTATEVTWTNSVYPTAGDLGFVYPGGTSTSGGRFGPNFLFTVVPVELQSFTVE